MKIRYVVAVAVFSLLFPLKSALAGVDFPPSALTPYSIGAVDTNTGNPCTPPSNSKSSKTCLTLSTPSSIAVGDFNDDGNLDLAVINQVPLKVGSEFKFYLSVLLGKGDGTFPTPPTPPILTDIGVGTPCPSNTNNLATCDRGVVVLAGDFNEDGKDDVVIIYFGNPTGNNVTNGKVGLFLSNGDGTFGAPTYTTVGRGAVNAAIGQLTSSGHLDVVVVNREEDSFSVLLGNGLGGLTVHSCDGVNPTCTTDNGKKPAAVAIGQFDADGNPDLAVTSLTDQKITLWKGAGNGSFAPFATPTMDTTLQSIQVLAEDFNRDGRTDLAVLNQQTKTVTMLFGNGDGTFTELTKNKLLLGKTPVGMAAADFNGDGALDLAFVFFPGKLAGVFAGLGDGTFTTSPVSLKVPGTSTGNFAVAAAPFNTAEPNRPHLAFANGIIAVMLNETVFPLPGFHITVTDPTGATTWTSATPQTVTWDYAGLVADPPNFKLDISIDGGAFKSLGKNIVGAPPPMTFTLKKGPTTKTPTTARIRVCSVDFPGICGESPDFTLSP
jgi:hypothetical protein